MSGHTTSAETSDAELALEEVKPSSLTEPKLLDSFLYVVVFCIVGFFATKELLLYRSNY
jgi:hypothetical protein